MGSQSQQVVLNDGDGGAYFGMMASSAASTVTLAADPWWAWMGTTNPQGAIMVIPSGTGVGQYSFLQSYTGRTITLATPWKVQPDGTSVVAITQYELYMTWVHNTFKNTLGATLVLSDALEKRCIGQQLNQLRIRYLHLSVRALRWSGILRPCDEHRCSSQ